MLRKPYVSLVRKSFMSICVNIRTFPTAVIMKLREEEIAGRGGVDFPKILKSLKAIGYNGAVDLDVIGAFTYPLSRQMGIAAETRGYMNRCFQELNK